MAIEVISTTDSIEDVTAANGGTESAETKVTEKKESASTPKEKDESKSEESETTEKDEVSESDESEETEDDEEKEEKEKRPKTNGFKKRINKLNAKISAKDQELEYWKAKALQEKKDQADEKPKVVEASADKPKSEDFESHEDFVEALTDWKLEQREKVKEQKNREVQAKTEFQTRVEKFQSGVKAFSQTVQDFDDVISDVDDISLSAGIQEALITSEVGPQVMYELAKDREELERINALTPLAQAREIGKIEAKLQSSSSSTEEKPIKTTKAPPPPNPVGKKAVNATASDEFKSLADFRKWEAAQRG